MPDFNPDAFIQENSAPEAASPSESPVPSESVAQFNPDEFIQQAQYGTPKEAAKAALEGAASAATFGASSGVERALGVPSEAIEGRREANPIAHGAGEVAGLLGSSVLGPLGAAGALEKAGAAAADLAGVSGVARAAVKGGIENLLFAGGDELSKALSGNPDTIQLALAKTGLSGAIGGVGGAALGKVSDLWLSKFGPKAEQFVQDFTKKLRLASDDPAVVAKAVEEWTPTPDEPIKNFFRPGASILNKAEEAPAEAVEPSKPSLGDRAADWVSNKAVDAAAEAASEGLGGVMGHATGIPGGGLLGAMFGHQVLRPLMQTMMPALIQPLLKASASGAGLKAALETVNEIARGEALINSASKAIFESGSKSTLDSLLPDKGKLKKLNDRMDQLSASPDAMLDMNGHLGHYMPDHQVALSSTVQGTMQHLADLRPREVQPAPLDRAIPPTKAQEASYDRSLGIADSPLSVLSHLRDGTLQPRDVQDLQAFYPALYAKMAQKVKLSMLDHLSKGNNMPFKLKRGLSTFLGEPLDSSFTAGHIQAAQATYMPPQSPQRPQGASVKKGTAKVGKSAELAQTPAQAREKALLKA